MSDNEMYDVSDDEMSDVSDDEMSNDSFPYVSDRFKTPEMCERVVEEIPWCVNDVPDRFKTQEMCDAGYQSRCKYFRIYS